MHIPAMLSAQDKLDARLFVAPDVADGIMKEFLNKLREVKGADKLAAVTCSIALPIDRGTPTAGEPKCLAGTIGQRPLPLNEAECLALLNEADVMVTM